MRRKNTQNPNQLELFSPDGENDDGLSTNAAGPLSTDAGLEAEIGDSNVEGSVVAVKEDHVSTGDTDPEEIVITISDDGGRTVGQILHQARTRLNLSVGAVAGRTNIRADYIKFLEDDAFQKLPSASFYTKSFLKRLCGEYDISYESLRDRYENSIHKRRTPAPITVNDRISRRTKGNISEPSAVIEKESDYGSAVKLAWVITMLIFVVAVIILVYVIGSRNETNVNQGAELNSVITDSDLERFIPPEELTFEELPLD